MCNNNKKDYFEGDFIGIIENIENKGLFVLLIALLLMEGVIIPLMFLK